MIIISNEKTHNLTINCKWDFQDWLTSVPQWLASSVNFLLPFTYKQCDET